MAPKPLLRIRSTTQKSFGEAFGAATGVSDPRLQKTQLRNNNPGGKAAAVAGYAGPGFHTWPPGHILQNNGSETAFSHPVHDSKNRSEKRSAPRPGSATHGYRKEEETSALLLFSQALSIQTQRQNCWHVFMDYKMVEARGVEPLS